MSAPLSTAGAVWHHGGTGCDVLDLELPEASWASTVEEEGGFRWLVVCPHGALASFAELADARHFAGHPAEFCEFHRSR